MCTVPLKDRITLQYLSKVYRMHIVFVTAAQCCIQRLYPGQQPYPLARVPLVSAGHVTAYQTTAGSIGKLMSFEPSTVYFNCRYLYVAMMI